MNDSETMEKLRFLRSRRRKESGGGERFQRVLKKTIRMISYFLFFSLVAFLGQRVYARLLETSSFQVREVEVEGQRRISQETLLSLASIEGMPNLFVVPIEEVAKRLQAHPWVESVRVRKTFPNKILLEIQERRPIAIVQLDRPYYIDAKGVIFSPVRDGDGYNYPFLTGLDRQAIEKNSEDEKQLLMKALELLSIVDREKPPPLHEISEIHMEKGRGLRCFTKPEGIEVALGWDSFPEKLRRLALVWADLRKRGHAVVSIDCRDPNRMVARKASRAVETGRR